jgi:pimeloyl-ACP methyl ester carboxylesterase
MTYSRPVDGFRLAYERHGSGPTILLLHGWPGDRTDFSALVPLLSGLADVVVPDLRGFGASDKHDVAPEQNYSRAAQARSVAGMIQELGLGPVVIGGYDVGSAVAQAVAAARPDLVRGLVVSPPLPGAGKRILGIDAEREFWYQHFHQLDLSVKLIDGRPDAVREYLRYFWSHWAGPQYQLTEEHLEHLVGVYGPPGAFRASIAFYRTTSTSVRRYDETTPRRADRLSVPTTVLWEELDPIFPQAWSDHLDDFFTDVKLQFLPGIGHFTPLEAPDAFATAIRERLAE